MQCAAGKHSNAAKQQYSNATSNGANRTHAAIAAESGGYAKSNTNRRHRAKVKARRAAVHTLCNQDDQLRELVLHRANGNVHAVLGYSVPLRDGSVTLTKGFVLTITVTTIGDNLGSVHSTWWLNQKPTT